MSCQVKICGISEERSLQQAVNSGVHLIGFVHFTRSPRHISLDRAAELKALLPAHVGSVMVLVDPDDALLEAISKQVAPTYLQLHGKETPARVNEIRKRYPEQKIIKAIPVSEKADLAQANSYDVDMLMFDAKPPKNATLPGGNGVAFDWKIMKAFASKKPWMLSGGLTPDNVAEAIRESGAKLVDVSSGVESAPGKKDPEKIRAFINAL
jgi:phosphoribosylanthranilate isomerase